VDHTLTDRKFQEAHIPPARAGGAVGSSLTGGTIPKSRFAAVFPDFPTFAYAAGDAFRGISRGRGYSAVICY